MGAWRRILLGCLLALAPGAALAERVVLFSDGRSMRVEGIERQEGMTLLSLTGGGRIAVPSARIARWTELPATTIDSAVHRVAPTRRPDDSWRGEAGEYAELIGEAAARYRIDPALLTAMARVESAFDPLAVSPKGAGGLLQLMPATAERFGVDDVFDVVQNVDGGARYLAWLLERYSGREELALAGYNAGEAAVDRYGGVPPYRETRSYVSLVLEGAGRIESPDR